MRCHGVPFLLAASLLSAAAATPAEAQFGRVLGGKVTDAVTRKAEQKLDEKIEQAAQKWVDRSFNAVFADDSASGGGKSSGKSRSFSLLPNAPTEPHYDFDVVLTYEIENVKRGKSDRAVMQMHFNGEKPYAGARFTPAEKGKDDGELFAIFDAKNESMVMLMESEEGKASFAYSWKNAAQYTAPAGTGTRPATPAAPSNTAAAATVAEPSFTKLGSRTIAGVRAEGYRLENPEETWDMWLTTDPSLVNRMYGAGSSMRQMRSVTPPSQPEGMLVESIVTEKKSGEKSRMTLTKAEKNAKVRVDMNDYPRVGKAK